ncbi:hypothetical protein BsWGS_09120 [Bradybaena similaris]
MDLAPNQSGYSESHFDYADNQTKIAYSVILGIQTKLMPAICLLGFATNFMSLLVFLQPNLRRLSCSVYLAVKAVSDSLFLLTVFIIWLVRVEVSVFDTTGVCQIVVFVSYFAAFVSIWLAVALTVENVLCVIKPWYVQRTCNTYSAGIITLTIGALGILLYHFSLWNNGVRSVNTNVAARQTVANISRYADHITRQSNNESAVQQGVSSLRGQVTLDASRNVTGNSTSESAIMNAPNIEVEELCVQLEEFSQFIKATTYIDSLMTLFVPLLILAVTNAVIVVLAVQSTRRRIRLYQQKGQYQLPGTHLAGHRHSAASLETQASRFLFAVSMTTLLFHLPSHMVRLKSLVLSHTEFSLLLQRIFETLYYTHYAIGLFVYLIFGINFRKVFFELVSRKRIA